MQGDRMAHRDILAHINAVQLLHAVEHGAILHIGMSADADFVHIAAQHGIHPDARVFAKHHVPDQLS